MQGAGMSEKKGPSVPRGVWCAHRRKAAPGMGRSRRSRKRGNIAHRKVENDAAAGEFLTKGDANAGEGASPDPYAHLLERVKRSVSTGGLLPAAATPQGGDRRLGALPRRTAPDRGQTPAARRKEAIKMAIRDRRGERYGRLTCIEPTEERGENGSVIWRCRCDCGKECLASGSQLSRGYKKSCGCMRQPLQLDLAGRRFGSLTVEEYAGQRANHLCWRCRCDCGQETLALQKDLLNGHTKSCGCLQRQMYRSNLRLVDGTSVTMIEKRKQSPIASNTSGYNGVYLNRRTGLWSAQITFKGKTYFLGSFKDIQDAVKARRKGEEMFDDFLEWYYAQHEKKAAQ